MSSVIADRRTQLPERESQVLSLAAKGYTDKQIAAELGISQETVGTYWRRILLRFGAASRTEVVAKYAETQASNRISAAEAETQALQKAVDEHATAHAQEARKRNLIEAIKEASLNFIGGSSSFGATFKQVLASALELTDSEYGFIAEVLYDDEGQPYLRTRAITNIAWDEESAALYERHEASGFEFRNLDTLFGRVLRTEQTFISNDAKNDRYAAGIPKGHPPLNSFLGLPVFFGPGMIGVIGLANRPGGYDQPLVEYLAPLAEACSRLVSAYRADMAWKEAERELVASAHRLSLLMDTLTSAVLFEDSSGRVEFVNSAFCRMFSLESSPYEMIGATCAEKAGSVCTLFRDPEGFGRRIGELFEKGEPVHAEILELADGRIFARDFMPVEVGGELRGHLWHYRDVTPRARERKMLNAILDADRDAVVVIDVAGVVHIWNKKATALFGYGREEAIGRELADLVVPKPNLPAYRAGLKLLSQRGPDEPLVLNGDATTKDGSTLDVEYTITSIGDETDRLYAAFIRPV